MSNLTKKQCPLCKAYHFEKLHRVCWLCRMEASVKRDKSPNEKNPTERPGWPYLDSLRREEKMRLAIRVNVGALVESVLFTQEHADSAEVLQQLKNFLVGREVKSISITIEEKTRHD